MARVARFAALLLLLEACAPKAAPPAASALDDVGCPLPPPDVFTKVGITSTFAQSTYGKVVVGTIDVKTNPEVVTLVSEAVRDARMSAYLRCQAVRRLGFTPEQAVHVEQFNAFLATKPTPAQMLEWQAKNPFPGTKPNVLFLTPELLGNPAYQSVFKTFPPSEKEAILRESVAMLRPAFRRVTDKAASNFEAKDFDNVRSICDFLIANDPNDGSALYYRGEVERLLRRRGRMRENFNLYLTYAPPTGAAGLGLRSLGYFDERTGWINHLLANDFVCEALQAKADPVTQRSLLLRVQEKVKQVRTYWRHGFDAGETTVSTQTLERAATDGLETIPTPKCPPMLM